MQFSITSSLAFSTNAATRLMTICVAALCIACSSPRKDDSNASVPETGIWQTASASAVGMPAFIQDAATASFVLLGETHDNPVHHKIQAQVLQALLARGNRPALVMEQYDIEQQPAIDRILADSASYDNKLERLSGLIGKGWDAPAYRRLLEIALQSSLPIAAANLSREAARDVVGKGFAAMGTQETARLMLEPVWLPEKQAALANTIRESHCGMLPEAAVTGMVLAQRARDGVMADRLLQYRKRGAVAILGRGHVMKDMAVPLYLTARDATARIVAVGLTEHEANGASDRTNPASQSNIPTQASLHYDYVWTTPGVPNAGNPCDAFNGSRPAPTATGRP